ncbi:MAG: homoserine kinase [Acidobacteriota bacterium]|nr:homoserine kinase [Acidobacteriota bacterium]
MSQPFHIRLPATSANLGPGFDALGLAMALYLTVDAVESAAYRIDATGRNAELCARLENNLILETYRGVLAAAGRPAPALHLTLDNQIPLGMGCGSSAAALLAGVTLANHFGALGWSAQQILEEACRREGHPDNVAACWLGGMTASAMQEGVVKTATCGQHLPWSLMLALPSASLATEKARALLPDVYSRADAVTNVQNTALLVAAFALGRADLLATAMGDRMHQPFRAQACPLLPRLLPLAGQGPVLGVALSGAGPSVLLVCSSTAELQDVTARVHAAAGEDGIEVLATRLTNGAAAQFAG